MTRLVLAPWSDSWVWEKYKMWADGREASQLSMWTGRGWISLVRVSCAVVVVVGHGGQRQVAAATTCGPEFALPVGRCWCCAGSWLVSPGQPRGEEQPWQWIWNETREYCEKRAMRGLIPKALGMFFSFPFFRSHFFFPPLSRSHSCPNG